MGVEEEETDETDARVKYAEASLIPGGGGGSKDDEYIVSKISLFLHSKC